MLTLRPFGVALALLALTACIPKAKYDLALAERDELQLKVEELSGVVDDQGEDLARLISELEASEAALEETNRKLAEKIAEAGELAEDIEAMKMALAEAEMRKARAEAVLRDFKDLVARFQSLIDAGTLKVRVIDGRMVVELATDILFPAGSATLSKEGRTAITEVATILGTIPDRQYQVAGHTDSVPIATERFPSNWHLGSARAISVVELLIEAGLPGERVSASSFAEYQPVDTNRTTEGRASNRRIEIVLVPDLSTLPGYEELAEIAEGGDAGGSD